MTKLKNLLRNRNAIFLLALVAGFSAPQAAPAIIDGLRQQGYELVTVSQLIGNPQPGQFYTDGQAPA